MTSRSRASQVHLWVEKLGVFVIRRLQDDMMFSAAGEAFKKRYIWQSLSDWKTWLASASSVTFTFQFFNLSWQWGSTWACMCFWDNLKVNLIQVVTQRRPSICIFVISTHHNLTSE